MATFTERLALIVDVREDGAVRGLQKVTGESKKAGQAADQTTKKFANLSTGMKIGIVAAAGVAAVKLAQFSGRAINAARDQNEVLNKSNVIFKGNAKEVENWASGGAKAFGLSKTAALDAAGSFGNMFAQLGFAGGATQKMSQRMVTLAADFASFHNADITEVLQAQQAGFRGEYDALQRFIPTITAATVQQEAMKETGKKNAQALTAQEKAAATYQIILDNVGQAQGDFARTSDSLANQQRIMNAQWEDTKAELGQALLPAMQKVTGVASDLLSAFNDLDPATRNLFLGLGAVVTATLLVGPRVIAVTRTMKDMGVTAGGASRGLAAFGIGLLGIKLAADNLTSSLEVLGDEQRNFGQKVGEYLKNQLKEETFGLVDLTDKSDDAKKATEDTKSASEEYAKMLGNQTSPAVQEFADVTEDAYLKQKLLNEQIVTATETDISFRDAVKSWTDEVHDAAKAGGDHARSLRITNQAGRDNISALIDMAKKANEHADAVFNQTDSLGKANRALKTDRERLLDAADAAGFNRDQVQKLIDKYLKVPTKAQTKLEQPGMTLAQARADSLKKKMEGLERDWKISMELKMKNRMRLEALATSKGMTLLVSGKPMEVGRAAGGWIRGAGGPTSDMVPAMLSNGEYVVKASAARKLGARFLDLINRADSVGGDPSGMVLKFAEGGSVANAQAFVRRQANDPYVWGGVGPAGFDCSGLTGAVYGLLKGLNPFHRYFTTASDFSRLGFRRGTGAYTIGVNPYTHMAGNIGGLPFEAASTRLGIRVGGAASPMSSFQQRWFLPGMGSFTSADIRKVMANIGTNWGVPFAGRTLDRGGMLYPVNRSAGPERVLSPAQTRSFDRLVRVLDRGGGANINVTINTAGVVGMTTMDLDNHLVSAINRVAGHGRIDHAVRVASR